MGEISKSQRRTFRDQDPPRIREQNLLKDVFEVSRSTPNSPTTLQRDSIEKCFSDPEFFRKQRQLQTQREEESNDSVENTTVSGGCNRGSTSSSRENNACTEPETENGEDWCRIKEVSFYFLLSFYPACNFLQKKISLWYQIKLSSETSK